MMTAFSGNIVNSTPDSLSQSTSSIFRSENQVEELLVHWFQTDSFQLRPELAVFITVTVIRSLILLLNHHENSNPKPESPDIVNFCMEFCLWCSDRRA